MSQLKTKYVLLQVLFTNSKVKIHLINICWNQHP
jgi:hypothetical protein